MRPLVRGDGHSILCMADEAVVSGQWQVASVLINPFAQGGLRAGTAPSRRDGRGDLRRSLRLKRLGKTAREDETQKFPAAPAWP